MSDNAADKALGGIGCLLAVACWIGGPLLVGWGVHSLTHWPTWAVVIIALVLGEAVGNLLLVGVLLPLFGIASLFGGKGS